MGTRDVGDACTLPSVRVHTIGAPIANVACRVMIDALPLHQSYSSSLSVVAAPVPSHVLCCTSHVRCARVYSRSARSCIHFTVVTGHQTKYRSRGGGGLRAPSMISLCEIARGDFKRVILV